MEMLHCQLKTIKNNKGYIQFADQTRFNIQVMHTWIQHGLANQLMHGPLLGWAKMKGHDLYMEKQDGLEFCMSRVQGLRFEQYPFKDHGLDICHAMKHLLIQGGFWSGTTQCLPSAAQLPKQSTYDQNMALLKKEFGQMWNATLEK